MTIGERVKDFRLKNLLTMREAAEIFGVSPTEILRIERGKNKMHFITQAKWEERLAKVERKKGWKK
jgi:transcriptional regulator with XRE-family HTH domain